MTPKYPSDDKNDTLIAQGDGWSLYVDLTRSDGSTFYNLFEEGRRSGSLWFIPSDDSNPTRHFESDTEDWPAEAREFALAHYNLNR